MKYFLAVLMLLLASSAMAQEQRHVFVFIDCSESMGEVVQGKIAYQEAVGWARSETEVWLTEGRIVHVIPFDTEPIDPKGLTLWAADDSGIDGELAKYDKYLQIRPGQNRPGTAIWRTLNRFIGEFGKAGPETIIRVYTDGDEENVPPEPDGHRMREGEVKSKLAKLWPGHPENVGTAIKVWTWGPDSRVPFVAVRMAKPPGMMLRLPEVFRKTATFKLPIKAVISPPALPQDGFVSADVKVERVGEGGGQMKASAKLIGALTRENPKGEMEVTLEGNFPPGFEHEFDLRFALNFHSRLVDLKEGERDQVAEARVVQIVRVSARPEIKVSVAEPGLDFYAGNSAVLNVTVEGNADAAGLVCNLGGSSASTALGLSFNGKNLAQVTVPEEGKKSEPVKMIVAGLVETKEKVNAKVTGALDGMATVASSVEVPVLVRRPIIRVSMAQPAARTVLAEEGEAAGKWQALGAGPIRLEQVGLEGKDVKVKVEVLPGQSEVELALDENGAKEKTVDLKTLSVPLLARFHGKEPPATITPTLPKVRVSVVADAGRKFGIDLQGGEVNPAGAVALAPAQVQLLAGKGELSGNTLKLPMKRMTAGTGDVEEIGLKWNFAAAVMKKQFAVDWTMPQGGEGLIEAADEGLVIEKGNQKQLTLSPRQTRGVLRLKVSAPDVAREPTGTYVVKLRDLSNPTAPPMTVSMTYDLLAPPFKAAFNPGKAVPVVADTPLVVGKFMVSGGERGSKVRARIDFKETPKDLKVEARVDKPDQETVTLTGGEQTYTLYLIGRGAAKRDLAGKAYLVLTVIPNGPVSGNIPDASRSEFDYQVRGWELVAEYNGKPCTQIEPTGDWDMVARPKLDTSKFHGKFGLKLEGGEVLDQLANRPVTLAVKQEGQVIGSAGFEVEGEAAPRQQVTMREIEKGKVKGIVMNKADSIHRAAVGAQYLNAELVMEGQQPNLKLVLPVKAIVPSRVATMAIVLGAIGLVVLGAVVVSLIRKLGARRPAVAAGPLAGGSIFADAAWREEEIRAAAAREEAAKQEIAKPKPSMLDEEGDAQAPGTGKTWLDD